MSLFHNAREIQMINPIKRKLPVESKSVIIKESYSCDLCTDEYDSETDLHVHRKSKHKLAMNKMLLEDNVCKTCIKKLDSHEQLIKHIKTVHLLSSEDSEYVEREIFVCNICHLIYFNKQMLSIHIQFSHDKARKKYGRTECPKCNRKIQVKNAWYHFQLHLTQSIGSCPICLKKCKNQIHLNYHVQNHRKYYRCTLCQYDASNRKIFDTHMHLHNNVSNDKVNEEKVKRYFVPQINTRRSDFNAGLRGYRLYDLRICVLCRAICTERTARDHISRFHVVMSVPEVKKIYTCSCSETFFNRILLRHHIFKMKSDDHKACD